MNTLSPPLLPLSSLPLPFVSPSLLSLFLPLSPQPRFFSRSFSWSLSLLALFFVLPLFLFLSSTYSCLFASFLFSFPLYFALLPISLSPLLSLPFAPLHSFFPPPLPSLLPSPSPLPSTHPLSPPFLLPSLRRIPHRVADTTSTVRTYRHVQQADSESRGKGTRNNPLLVGAICKVLLSDIRLAREGIPPLSVALESGVFFVCGT